MEPLNEPAKASRPGPRGHSYKALQHSNRRNVRQVDRNVAASTQNQAFNIDQLDGYKWIMAQLMYGSGLRVMECVRLRVKGVDFGVLKKGGRGVQSPGDMLWN